MHAYLSVAHYLLLSKGQRTVLSKYQVELRTGDNFASSWFDGNHNKAVTYKLQLQSGLEVSTILYVYSTSLNPLPSFICHLHKLQP